MSITSIPDDVRQFIWRCIDRLETLDVLLLLQGTPQRTWSAKEVSTEMRSSTLAAETVLRDLAGFGLLQQEGESYRFRPQTPDLDLMTRHLATCYREKRTAIITLIFSRPAEAVRGFANAFKLKKGPSDG